MGREVGGEGLGPAKEASELLPLASVLPDFEDPKPSLFLGMDPPEFCAAGAANHMIAVPFGRDNVGAGLRTGKSPPPPGIHCDVSGCWKDVCSGPRTPTEREMSRFDDI